VDFLIYLILPAHYGPVVDSVANRNGYQESSALNLPPSVGQLSRENMGASKSHNPMGLHGLLQG
jgi:hypothetical protein